MALPIQSTPILTGDDAKRFIENMEKVDRGENPISEEVYNRAKRVYEEMIKNGNKF